MTQFHVIQWQGDDHCHIQQSLGLILNTCNKKISILDGNIASLNTLLKTTWGPHKKSLFAHKATELTDELGHVSIRAHG